jgi:hypothetical protein
MRVAWNKGLTKYTSPLLRKIGHNISKALTGRFLGSNHPRWKEKKEFKCFQCKKIIVCNPSKQKKFCSRQCLAIWRSENLHGKNSCNWKGGISKPYCIDCGKRIWTGFTRCKRCSRKGEKNPNWKGGTSNIRDLIRSLKEYKEWKKAVLKKCNYTCQKCGKRGGRNLDAHHFKKSYSHIVKDFLNKYNQFSPVEDRETLLRLAISHNDFWNIDNGIILCRSCHKEIENYFFKGANCAITRN